MLVGFFGDRQPTVCQLGLETWKSWHSEAIPNSFHKEAADSI